MGAAAGYDNDHGAGEEGGLTMVIHETALVRQMKAAYKDGGYIVACRRETTAIMSSTWITEVQNEHLPREALGLIAQHLGFLPEEGEAYRTLKGEDEPSVQTMLFDTAIRPMAALEAALADQANAPRVELRKTLLTFDGWNLWQKRGNGGMVLVDPELESIFRKKDDVILIEDGLYKQGLFSRVFIMPGRDEKHQRELDHLGNRWQ